MWPKKCINIQIKSRLSKTILKINQKPHSNQAVSYIFKLYDQQHMNFHQPQYPNDSHIAKQAIKLSFAIQIDLQGYWERTSGRVARPAHSASLRAGQMLH